MIIPEWRRAWRMLSVQLAALLVVWLALPADTQAAVLALLPISKDAVTGVLGVMVILGRLVAQPQLRQGERQP